MWLRHRRLFQTREACPLDRLVLHADHGELGGSGTSCVVTQRVKAFHRSAQFGIEAADPEPRQDRLDAVDDPRALAHQTFPLTARASASIPLVSSRSSRASPTAETGQESGEVVTERIAKIAAFLDDDRRQVEPGYRLADAREANRRHRQAAERIALKSVETERHYQRFGREGANAPEGYCERFQKCRVAGFVRQRQVQVVAEAGAFAALAGVAPEKGI